MGGEDADWIGWEQSFNCGRARDIPEFVARVSLVTEMHLVWFTLKPCLSYAYMYAGYV